MIRKRLLWLFVLQILLVLAISGIYLQFKLRNTLEKELGVKLESLAATIAGQLDAGLITLLAPGDETGRVYSGLQGRVAAMEKAGQISRIIAFSPLGTVWLDSRNHLAIGVPYLRFEYDRTEIHRVLQNQNSQSPLFTGHDGLFYKTGYAPVRSAGKVVGVLAVEGSAASLRSVREMQTTLLQIGLVSLVVAVLLSWFSSQRLTQPLQRLRHAAERLGQGRWEESISVNGKDEIGFLAATMEEMRKNILQHVEQQKAMMAGVAHELRNPLGGIELFAGLISDEARDDESRQRALRILKESRHLKELVQDFLDYARPITARPQACSLAGLWQEAVDLAKAERGDKQITFHCRHDARVWVDPQHLRQVLLNLLLNSVQSIDQPSGRIELHVATNGNVCNLLFTDNGRGIPAEIQSRIFEPFFSRRENGLGLGLAMVKNLLVANNGAISLADGDHTGARFHITLPAATKI
jgi:signal transduction histidine kinase